MNINEIYKRWAAEKLGIKPDAIEKVTFSSHVNDYTGDEYDTFGGCEMWQSEVYLQGDKYPSKSINHWDMNPVSEIMGYVRQHNLTVEFPPPNEPTVDDQVETHIRSTRGW
jgi:hypothetical protein